MPGSQPQSPPIGRSSICLLSNTVLNRLAYRSLLENQLHQQVVAEADFTPSAVWAAMRSQPGLVLVEADTATTPAIEAVQIVSQLHAAARILIVGGTADPIYLHGWRRCRIHGYVLKNGGLDELRAAIEAVSSGRQYYSEGTRSLVRRSGRQAGGRPLLSQREAELLPLLACGLPLREAAQRMCISYKTADSYRTSLLRKLGLHDRVELARYAIRERIIDP
jgi:DNA-binding NarL/FixJ family response regulator